MRTTLTLDDDVATKLRQLAHRRRRPFKEVVNAVLRRGLAAPQRGDDGTRSFQVETFRSALRAGVDPMRLNQLADELDAERFVAKSTPPTRHGPA
jgi:predicted transcriptional regulator